MANLRKHEVMGLVMMFISGCMLGIGLYYTFWTANRPLYYGSLDYLGNTKDFIILLLLFGFSFVLFAMGQIELKFAMPGKRK